jgi:hypothetical protein
MKGNIIHESTAFTGSTLTIREKNLDDGIYFLVIEPGDEQLIEKVVIQK